MTRRLRMPSGSRVYNSVPWSSPKLVMNMKSPEDIHSLKLMMNCTHQNILHAKIITTDAAWTEPFTGFLIDFLKHMKSDLGDWMGMVPSPPLQAVVSQWFDGIGHLRQCGKYHGNFSLENTCYHIESGTWMPIVKFTNFRVKDGKSLIECQLEDVLDIARGLDGICHLAQRWNMTRGAHDTLDCCLVIDLAKKLRQVSRENLVSVMKDIKKHMFFWDGNDKRRFYICDLPFALRSPDFMKAVESSGICSVPWNVDDYCGLLLDMNSYRAQKNLPAYDGKKKTEFCSFCSGLYTHEAQLHAVKFGHVVVEAVLETRNRKACFDIVSLMPDRETKYMLSKRTVQS